MALPLEKRIRRIRIAALALGFGLGLELPFLRAQVDHTGHLHSIAPATEEPLDLLTAIGLSEGTRTADGGKTEAWAGHTDPGNAAWNMGSCSWQATQVGSPEEADALCLKALQRQLQAIPDGKSDFVKLAYLDAWVQAPAAAQDFFKLLEEAAGKTEFERVLEARVRSFIDPATGTWDAPGLGNDADRIRADQERRLRAILHYLGLRQAPKSP